MSEPRKYSVFITEENEIMSGSNYGCVDGWREALVVEKSAYDTLQAHLKIAVDALEEVMNVGGCSYCTECAACGGGLGEAQNEGAKALTEIEKLTKK